MTMDALIAVLEASVKRKGEVPLTNAHLLSILKMATRLEAARGEALRRSLDDSMADDRKWGSD